MIMVSPSNVPTDSLALRYDQLWKGEVICCHSMEMETDKAKQSSHSDDQLAAFKATRRFLLQIPRVRMKEATAFHLSLHYRTLERAGVVANASGKFNIKNNLTGQEKYAKFASCGKDYPRLLKTQRRRAREFECRARHSVAYCQRGHSPRLPYCRHHLQQLNGYRAQQQVPRCACR